MVDDNVVDRDNLGTTHAGLMTILLELGIKSVFIDDDQEHAHVFYLDINTPPITVIL